MDRIFAELRTSGSAISFRSYLARLNYTSIEMFEKLGTERSIWIWRWPLIAIAVLAALTTIQLIRVNRPKPAPAVVRSYTPPGRLLSGEISIPSADYHAVRVDLNRRTKITGTFRTSDLKSTISVLVIKESELEAWKSNSKFEQHTRTGYVPGGKINPVLDPGTYMIIFDNRQSETPRIVTADITLE